MHACFGLDQAVWLLLTELVDWAVFSTGGRTTVGGNFPMGRCRLENFARA